MCDESMDRMLLSLGERGKEQNDAQKTIKDNTVR